VKEHRFAAGVISTVINGLALNWETLHNDLGIPIISDVIKERSNKHHNRLETNTKPMMQPLQEEPNYRRLKRRLPIDLK
jgi:hypothetical protein